MFNENDGKWIGYYKTYTIVMFWLYVVATIVMCILDWTWVIWIIDGGFLDTLIILVSGFLVAGGHLIGNMLIIQLLNNIQTIRETVANRASKQNVSCEVEELKKYKKLLDMDAITADEYEAKKVQLLEQI